MMSSSCPKSSDLLRLLDGEITRNEEARLRAHLDGCPACKEQSRLIKQLLGDVAAPIEGLDAAASVKQVLGTIRRQQAAPPQPSRSRMALRLGIGFGMAAAAALGLVMLHGHGSRLEGDFQMRGGTAGSALERRTGISLYAPFAQRRPLREGALLPTETAITATYRNLDEKRPVYLLVFGVDAQGEIHWLYPAYTEPSSDPEAIRLPFSSAETALPDSVVLENPAPGKMRVFSILTPHPLRVSAIESLKGAELTLAALQKRWTDCHVESISVTLQKGISP